MEKIKKIKLTQIRDVAIILFCLFGMNFLTEITNKRGELRVETLYVGGDIDVDASVSGDLDVDASVSGYIDADVSGDKYDRTPINVQ